jgi:phosphatidylglycerol---prolipoprotein diacylglyceryl transferase
LLPKLISYGNFYLPTYGVLVALGFLAGLMVTVRLARRSGLNPELMTNLAVYVALAGMLGAKLLMIVFDWQHYMAAPSQILSMDTLQAAGVFQGGLILALATAVFYMHRQGLPFLKASDAFAPGIALGHSIGRLGCLAAGCCWGKECTLPWAITFHNPQAWALTGVPLETPLHPSQLYEFSTEGILFGFLYWRYGKNHAPGQIIGLYLVISSVARFLIEFTRFHEQALPFGLPLSITQWIAIGLAAAGAILLLRVSPAKGQPAKPELRPAKPVRA